MGNVENDKGEGTLISTDFETFELILGKLEKIDESRLEALVSLREKLKFNSDNPKLIVKTSRQVAVGTKIDITLNLLGKDDKNEFKAVVQLNTPNFIFLKIDDHLENKLFENNLPVTISFRPLRQKMVYQFEADSQGSVSKGLLRINHSNSIKIIEEL